MIANHEYYYEGAISPDQVRVNEPLHVEDIYAHVYFYKEEGKLRGDFDFQYLLASGKPVLCIPRAKNFDGWDAVLVTSHASSTSTSASTSASSASENFTTVVFFQISLEYPESARRWPKFLSAMNSPSPSTTTTTTITITEQVLQMIFPSTRWHTSLDIGSKRFCISSLPSSATEAAVTTPKNITFRFVMVTPKGNETRPSMAMRKGSTPAPATISNLEIIGVQHFIPG